jgi:predicted nucleotidyltransferase
MKQLLTEWRKFIKEQEEEAEIPKTKAGDLIVSLIKDPNKTPTSNHEFQTNPGDFASTIKDENQQIEDDDFLQDIKGRLKAYYEDPAILNKINKKAKLYSKGTLKKYLKGQIDKIKLLSIFGSTSIDQLNRNSDYRLAIKTFRQSPLTAAFIPTRKALSPTENLLVLVNPIAFIETDFESMVPEIVTTIQRDINTTLAKTSRQMKEPFKTLPDDKVLMLLKNAMLKQDMFDNRGNLNKKGKEFIEKIKTRPEITDLIKLELKSEEVLQQIFDALKDDTFLSSLEKNLVQITKADQGEEEVATA